jgi:hypothetical protein
MAYDPRLDPNSAEYDAGYASTAQQTANDPRSDPRSDPNSKEYDPTYAAEHRQPAPRAVAPSLADVNAFKMEMNTRFEDLSASIAHLRQHGGATASHYDEMQNKLTAIRHMVHSFGI